RRPVAAVLDLPQRFAARRTPPRSEQRFRPPESVAAGAIEMERSFSQARRARASIPAYPNAIVASLHTRLASWGKVSDAALHGGKKVGRPGAARPARAAHTRSGDGRSAREIGPAPGLRAFADYSQARRGKLHRQRRPVDPRRLLHLGAQARRRSEAHTPHHARARLDANYALEHRV